MATLTRSLKELQVLPERIKKEMGQMTPAAVVVGSDGIPSGFKTEKEYVDAQHSRLNAVIDLVERQVVLAEDVARANATTEINLKGYPRKLTVAGAVKLRQVLKAEVEPFVDMLRQFVAGAESRLVNEEVRYQQRLDALLANLLGKDARTRGEDVKGIEAQYRASQGPRMVRGVTAEELDKLVEMVKLINEIDLTLSETNGRIEI